MKPVAIVAAVFLFHANSNALNECMATLKDPHGSVIVRRYGELVSKLKGGEHFPVEPMPGGWNVYLKSGCDGFIEKADLQLLPNEPLMKLNYNPQKTEWRKAQSARDRDLGEAGSGFKERGLNYFKILTAASNGDEKAMALFYSVCGEMDGAAAEGCFCNGWELFHVIDDETFSKFLSTQPAKMRASVLAAFLRTISA